METIALVILCGLNLALLVVVLLRSGGGDSRTALLEGLVRKNGLSLEAAREAFAAGMEPHGGLPEGWRWLKAWETP